MCLNTDSGLGKTLDKASRIIDPLGTSLADDIGFKFPGKEEHHAAIAPDRPIKKPKKINNRVKKVPTLAIPRAKKRARIAGGTQRRTGLNLIRDRR
jgi:hypothetical protein